ncbi:TetR-like C-terminal domain-containing protein [Clostridium intestinale]|uniref:TetR/AcrR family transcriptional regulator n=1 Tax=Clostridium intestinale TaxID=36845 RepID=UPI0028E9CB35|nr:TetR-like C-terminal domain-containing protein [Clostridium intestinale]
MDNAEKNSYVKKQITNALISLLKEKELKDISVSEITTVAQVSRISFYRNYDDKKTIIKEYMSFTLNEWNKNHPKTSEHTEDDILGDIFAYITEYKDFYLVLRNREIFYFLKDIIIDALGPKAEYPNFGAYTAAFIANGIYGWIEEWFLRGMQESGEEMTKLLKSRSL